MPGKRARVRIYAGQDAAPRNRWCGGRPTAGRPTSYADEQPTTPRLRVRYLGGRAISTYCDRIWTATLTLSLGSWRGQNCVNPALGCP